MLRESFPVEEASLPPYSERLNKAMASALEYFSRQAEVKFKKFNLKNLIHPCTFWENNENVHPELAKMAQILIELPAGSSKHEQSNRVNHTVHSKERCQMKRETVENLTKGYIVVNNLFQGVVPGDSSEEEYLKMLDARCPIDLAAQEVK